MEIWPTLKRHSDVPDFIRASNETQSKIQRWLTQAMAESPPAHPITVWPTGSWAQSATNIMLIMQTKLWDRDGHPVTSTTTIAYQNGGHGPNPLATCFGNSNGRLVPEVRTADTRGTGSWERTALSVQWFLSCDLKSVHGTYNRIMEEIKPIYAYGNSNGCLVQEKATSRPPAAALPPGQKRGRANRSQSQQGESHVPGGQGVWAEPPPPPQPPSQHARGPEDVMMDINEDPLSLPPLPSLSVPVPALELSSNDLATLQGWFGSLTPSQRNKIQWAAFFHTLLLQSVTD